MYWIYLTIFVVMVFAPHFVREGNAWLGEEELESLAIFGLGMLAFVLYLTKEKALLRTVREQLLLQKQTNIITRDLSDSYSYIGELNRKFDIVKSLAFQLPQTFESGKKGEEEAYSALLEAVTLLAKCDHARLSFVRLRNKERVWTTVYGTAHPTSDLPAERLASSAKTFWEDGDFLVARSPKNADGVAAFLIFPKLVNAVEDADIFKILAAEALFLFCGRQHFLARQAQERV